MNLHPIDTAPRDGTRFWGLVDGDLLAMCWHEHFGAFVRSWHEMTMASGYMFDDGSTVRLHSPDIQHPEYWTPIVHAPARPARGE